MTHPEPPSENKVGAGFLAEALKIGVEKRAVDSSC